MSTATLDEPKVETNGQGAPIVAYSPSDAAIAEAREKFSGLTCETPAKYKETTDAIAVLRGWRVAVEKKRVALKADALAWGRKVDSEAKRITALIEEVELPLKARKQEVDDAKERAKREAEEKAKREEEARIKAEREAEEARLAAERERLAEERRKLEEEKSRIEAIQRAEREKAEAEARRQAEELERKAAQERAAQEVERQRLAAERRALDEQQAELRRQQEAAERAEFERQAREQAEKAAVEKAKAKAEYDRMLAEERRKAAEAEAARLEALRPDVEKVHIWAQSIADLIKTAPLVNVLEAEVVLGKAKERLAYTASELLKFGGPKS